MFIRHANLNLDQKGMGLIEVIMASVVLAVVLLGASSMIVQGQKGAASVQKRLDAGQLGSFITSILSNPVVCAVPAAGLINQPAPVNGANVPALTFPPGASGLTIATGTYFENGAIQVISLKYTSVVNVTATTSTAMIALVVSAQGASSDSVVGGNVLAPQYFPATFTIAGGLIVGCGAASPLQKIHFAAATVPTNGSYDPLSLGCQNWPNAFPSTSYSVSCSGINVRDAAARPIGHIFINSKSATSICMSIANEGSQNLSVDGVDCIGSP